jgi:hypothetical protein
MYEDRMFENDNEYLSFLSRVGSPMAMGIGNVYHVVKTSEVYYSDIVKRWGYTYADESQSLQNSIAGAVKACVANRNDYVIVNPSQSDYDISSVLVLAKKAVHLICPAGLGYDVGATNAARVHQNTAASALMALSNSAIEIAGFYLKPYADISHLTIAAGSYGLNIHHNFFTLSWGSGPAPAILCAGDGGAWGIVAYRNLFQSMSGDNVTCASLITIGSSATGARCNHNTIIIGDGNTLTVGITNSAVKGETNFNTFSESGGLGVGSGGHIAKAVSIHATGHAIGNRVAGADGTFASGGTAGHSFADNQSGGTGNTGGQITNLEA